MAIYFAKSIWNELTWAVLWDVRSTYLAAIVPHLQYRTIWRNSIEMAGEKEKKTKFIQRCNDHKIWFKRIWQNESTKKLIRNSISSAALEHFHCPLWHLLAHFFFLLVNWSCSKRIKRTIIKKDKCEHEFRCTCNSTDRGQYIRCACAIRWRTFSMAFSTIDSHSIMTCLMFNKKQRLKRLCPNADNGNKMQCKWYVIWLGPRLDFKRTFSKCLCLCFTLVRAYHAFTDDSWAQMRRIDGRLCQFNHLLRSHKTIWCH